MTTSAAPYRPRSIFWPLVLVAVGGVWLLTSLGVITAPNVWVLFKFWPVALIAIGLELLLRQRWPFIGNLLALATVTLAVVAVVFARPLGLAAAGTSWVSYMPFQWGEEAGSGPLVSEERAVGDFDRVTFTSFGELTIRQGDTPSLLVEAQANVLPEIITEVQEHTLTIRYAERNGAVRVQPTQPIRLTLVVTDLAEVTLSGAGDVRLTDLRAADLQVILSGAGSLSAAGTVNHLEVVLSGAGSFNGGALQSQSANVTLSGVGNAVVWATHNLYVTISGVGWVEYYGDPAVTKDVGGLGGLTALGDK